MTQNSSNNGLFRIVDCAQPVNNIIDQAKVFSNEMPIAIGRYFTTEYPVEYSHKLENNVFHKNNIKLLPIARHTNHVGGSRELGITDAQAGVEDLFSTFDIEYWHSQGNEFLFFLDVEGNSTGPNGPISEEYYKGWSETLVSYSKEKSNDAVTILPCVYANYHDNTTFSILVKNYISCHGLWIARYHNTPQKWPSWDENFAVPQIIQDSSLPVFLRQYASGEQVNQAFDLDQTNPNILDLNTSFVDKLILPPSNV